MPTSIVKLLDLLSLSSNFKVNIFYYFHNQHTRAANIKFFIISLRYPRNHQNLQLSAKNQNKKTLWGVISQCKMTFLKSSYRYRNCNWTQLSPIQLLHWYTYHGTIHQTYFWIMGSKTHRTTVARSVTQEITAASFGS